MSEHVNKQDQDKKPGQPSGKNRPSSQEKRQPPPDLQSDILTRLGLSEPSILYPSAESLPQLRDQLKSKEWQTRVLAIQSMAELGEQAPVQDIIDCQDDAHEAVRMAAIRALGKLAMFDIVSPEPFFYALNDDKRDVRATALQVLASLGRQGLRGPQIEDLVKKLFEKDEKSEDALVRVEIVQLLGSRGKDAPLKTLIEALQDVEYQVRESAVLILGTLWNHMSARSFMEILIAALYDEEHFVREAAVIALQNSKLPVNPLINLLLKNLYGSDATIQAKATRALRELRIFAQSVRDALHEIAIKDETELAVRIEAILALTDLGKQGDIDQMEIAMLLNNSNEDIHDAAMGLADALYPGQFQDESDRRIIDFHRHRNKNQRDDPL